MADIQQLNQELSTLKDMSPVAAEALQRPVEEINQRWAALLKGITDREVRVNITQTKNCRTHVSYIYNRYKMPISQSLGEAKCNAVEVG